MAALTLDLSAELIDRLRHEAERSGKRVDTLVAEVLEAWLGATYHHPDVVPADAGERERVRAALQAAGLRATLGPEAQRLAQESSATLEEVEAAFARAGGQPLSEIVLELRGPKP